MDGALEAAERANERLGPGLLVLVVGPSGAGKDTLLAYARRQLTEHDVLFARRHITRASDHTEDHLSIDFAAFEQGVAEGRFPLHWRANGLGYALGEDVREAIQAGRTVVANGSRATVAEARLRFVRIKVVLVTAPFSVLAARIAARGREAHDDAAQRMAREPTLDAPPDIGIINDGAIEQAGERLAAYLAGL
ncbi:MAG TPA: phosphonate metabolism protein/1,5-bisphosphokinase (PRPP-forming) PhnN [Ancylobacter sp.]